MTPQREYRGWIREEAHHIENLGEPLDGLLRRAARPAPRTQDGLSLRSLMPPIKSQGGLNACTAHALSAALGYLHHGRLISRLELYYFSRAFEQKQHEDAGARLSNALRVLIERGVGLEHDWPYPPDGLMRRAFVKPRGTPHKGRLRLNRHAHVRGGAEIRACLEAGLPVVMGIHESDAFFSDRVRETGVLPRLAEGVVPPHTHAVCVIGYAPVCAKSRAVLPDADPQRDEPHYEVRNSWGAAWGDAGHFWVPASYLEDPRLAGNALTIRS